jgi:hypothetical protein
MVLSDRGRKGGGMRTTGWRMMAAMAALALPATAAAASHQVMAGLEIGWTFGGQGHHVGLGATGAYSVLPIENELASPDLGLFVGLHWTRLSWLSASAGIRGGVAFPAQEDNAGRYRPGFSGVGELGGTLRSRGGPALHVGAAAQGLVFTARYSQEIGRASQDLAEVAPTSELPRWSRIATVPGKDETLALGFAPGWMPLIYFIDGRPLREGEGARLAPIRVLGAADSRARRWIADGRDEHASIAAFVRLARELQALGAPKSLVGRALSAAGDEVGHAAMCFAMAGVPLEVGRLSAEPRPVRSREAALSRLAAESLIDGVEGEGAAAKRAAGHSGEGEAIKARIAVEERGHAGLGGDIAAWCAREGGAGVVRALKAAERLADAGARDIRPECGSLRS